MANVHNTAMSHLLAFLLFALSAKFVSKTVSCPDVTTCLQNQPMCSFKSIRSDPGPYTLLPHGAAIADIP